MADLRAGQAAVERSRRTAPTGAEAFILPTSLERSELLLRSRVAFPSGATLCQASNGHLSAYCRSCSQAETLQVPSASGPCGRKSCPNRGGHPNRRGSRSSPFQRTLFRRMSILSETAYYAIVRLNCRFAERQQIMSRAAVRSETDPLTSGVLEEYRHPRVGERSPEISC